MRISRIVGIILFVLIFLVVVLAFIFLYRSESQTISRVYSPDLNWITVVQEVEAGNSFGATYYVVVIRPNSLFGEFSSHQIIKMESFADTRAPSVMWRDARFLEIYFDASKRIKITRVDDWDGIKIVILPFKYS